MAGRPPNEKTFANMLRIAIKEAHGKGGTKLRAVAEALVDKALTGDVPAIREIGDRLDGKVPQVVDQTFRNEDDPTNWTEAQVNARIAELQRKLSEKEGNAPSSKAVN